MLFRTLLIFTIVISLLNNSLAAQTSKRKHLNMLDVLNSKLEHSSSLQSVINHNISQANMPKAKAKTLERFSLRKFQKENENNRFEMVVTNNRHMGIKNRSSFRLLKDPDANEVTPVGNNIVLTDQLKNASNNNIDFTEYSKLLRSGYNMLKIAASSN